MTVKKEKNIDLPDLVFIELTGEMLLPEIKNTIKNNFGVPVYNLYGMQEFNTIAYEDHTGEMKCLNKNVFVEILDDNNNPCTNETEGNIVVTSLKNSYMPLVRYLTLDRGFLTTKNGNEYLTIVKSRANINPIDQKQKIEPSLFFWITEKLNAKGNNIYQFQYQIKNNCLYCILISSQKINNNDVEEYIIELLTKFDLKFDKIYIINDPQKIAHNFGNKLNYFINYDSQQSN